MAPSSAPRLLVNLAYLAAALAYSGWVLTATLGNPAVTAELTVAVLQRPAVVERLVDQGAPLLGTLSSYGIPAESSAAIASDVLADPRVAAEISASVVDTHQYMLDGSGPAYLYVPASTLTAAVRDAAAAQGLDPATIPDLPDTAVSIPGSTHVATVDRWASRWPFAALVAAVLLAVAVALSFERSRTVAHAARRVTISSGILLAGTWILTQIAERTGNSAAVSAATMSRIVTDITHPTLRIIFAVAAITWVVAWAVHTGRIALPTRTPRNRSNVGVGERPADVRAAGTPRTPSR
jgi:hypothetical protein